MPKRIISFSVFGDSSVYLEGALRNVRLASTVYPGWTARVYCSHEIPNSLITRMQQEGAEIIHKRRVSAVDGTFWRFLPLADPKLDAVIVRDVDSRINEREKAAVEEWLASGRSLHIMRDHPLHKVPIMAGMWGGRGGCVPDMEQLIQRWNLWQSKGQDQDFLRDVIYPRFEDDCVVHSNLFEYDGETAIPFPTERNLGEFVGSVVEADRDAMSQEELMKHLPLFQQSSLRRLPRVRSRPKAWLLTEQWFRSIRKRAS